MTRLVIREPLGSPSTTQVFRDEVFHRSTVDQDFLRQLIVEEGLAAGGLSSVATHS